MGLIDIDEKDIKASPKEERLENKKSPTLPIVDSLLDEVNRNAEIIINNPELAKISKNILQNEYIKLQKQLYQYFNINDLNINTEVVKINGIDNIMLSLNTTNLLDEQKELVYNSIGTVFADKFDIEFKVTEGISNNSINPNQLEISFSSNDLVKTSAILQANDIFKFAIIKDLCKFNLPNSNSSFVKIKNIKSALERGDLYDKQRKFTTKGIKATDVSRISRLEMFRTRIRTVSQSGYEQRRESRNNNETVSNATRDLGLGEKTFFREKLDICIKNYDMLFEKAIKMSNVKNMSKLMHESFNVFNIQDTNINIQTALDNKSLSSLISKLE